MKRTHLLIFLLSLFPWCLHDEIAVGQTSYPMITHTSPVAVQRGKTSEITVSGQMDFSGVYKVLFEGCRSNSGISPAKARRKAGG